MLRAQAASNDASISGRIVDPTHKPVAGAKVELFQGASSSASASAVAMSGKDGSFKLAGFAQGPYRLEVMKMGYALQVLEGLQVEAHERLIVGEPIELRAASAEDVEKMACNSVVQPSQTGDVYVVCAGK
jgi:carboxypeptidase family protein